MLVNKTTFDEIVNLIESSCFSDAELKLLSVLQSKDTIPQIEYSYACYLRGYLHTRFRYEEKKQYIANQMLLENIESNHPHPYAYCLYANLLEDKNTAVNYLKKGLLKFSNDTDIYITLLQYCSWGEIEIYIEEIKQKGIRDSTLLCKVVEIILSKNDWSKAEYFLGNLVEINSSDVKENLYYKSLYTYSMLVQQKNLENCKKSFQNIINEDVSNSLNYSQYMGYIWCCVITKDFEDAISYIQKIPVANVLRDFDDGPWWNINVNMISVYQKIFADVLSIIDDNEAILKIKALEALYIYSPSDMLDINRFSKKHLSDLKRYNKKYVDNIEVACAIFYMQKHFKKYYDAYKTYMSMLQNYLNPHEKYIEGLDFLNLCNEREIIKIYEDIIKILNSQADFDIELFVTDIFDMLIEYFWGSSNKDKYQKIVNLAEPLKDYQIEKSNYLFEISYSYAQLDNKSGRAERLYKLCLKFSTQNSSVLNNLGVIYEKRGDLEKALGYFEAALKLANTDDLYQRNYKRVASEIKKYQGAVNGLEKENAWLLGRLAKLCTITDNFGEFTCTYKERSSVLGVSPQKGDELFDKFIKLNYIFKVPNEGVSKYRVNPIVINYLSREKVRLEKNNLYEMIGNKINIDEIERIGYTEHVIDSINLIQDISLREILRRDIQECAISVVAEQYKSSIVLCGSIIEAILVYIIGQRGYSKYDIGTLLRNKPRTKSVKEMDLNELLELCRQEKIINVEEYHLSNYVRAYRNIIHPSCEVRKSYNVDSLTANLMWNALLAIMREVIK